MLNVPSGITDVNSSPVHTVEIIRDGLTEYTTLPGPDIEEPESPITDQYFDFSLLPKPNGGYTVQHVIWLHSADCVYSGGCKYVPTCSRSGVSCIGGNAYMEAV